MGDLIMAATSGHGEDIAQKGLAVLGFFLLAWLIAMFFSKK